MLISVQSLASRWGMSPRTILHVGAHEAEEMAAYDSHGWGSERTVWVEGQPELAARLSERLAGRAHHRIIHAVAWDAVEAVTFYRTNNSQSSSALPLKLHSAEYPSIVVAEESRVTTSRLDEVLSEDRILDLGIDFANLDIQGAELRALKGLGHHLSHVGAVYSEVNIAELYEGCATLRELDGFLHKHGFVLVDIRLTDARWGDALWLPKRSLPLPQRLARRLVVELRVLEARCRSSARKVRRATRGRILAGSLRLLALFPLRLRHSFLALLEASVGKGFVAGLNAEIDRLLSAASPPTVAIDVGANVGDWSATLRAKSPATKIYVFEPAPAAYERLAKRFVDDPQVVAVNVALGSEAGTARLWSDAPGSGLASLYQRDLRHIGISLNHSDEVTVTTLDAWCTANAVSPDALKLDVEGHELDVLRGAEQTLKSVRLVQFEFGGTAIDAGCYWKDYWHFFAERGFKIFRMAPIGLVPLSKYSELDEAFSYQNFIAVREPD